MNTNTVVIFKSELFDRIWPKDGSDPNYPPWGKDLAEYFRAKAILRSIDAVVLCEGGNGWEFDLVIDGITYILYFHWAPIGDLSEDHWVIQIRKRKGFLKLLWDVPNDSREVLAPAIVLVEQIIVELPEKSHVQWMDFKQFSQIY